MKYLTLPTGSQERKEIPITSGVLAYFPAAIAGVARVSYLGNQKHNPGQPLHHARGKSTDHADCVARHLMDVNDLQAEVERTAGYDESDNFMCYEDDKIQELLLEVSQLAWRALALSQALHEKYVGAPLAPAAQL